MSHPIHMVTSHGGTDVEDEEVNKPNDDEEQPVTARPGLPKRKGGMPKHLADYELY